MKTIVVVPWHNPQQLAKFEQHWGKHESLLFQQDKDGSGCAKTKNAGVARAVEMGAEVVVVLDDDCYPSASCATLLDLVQQHLAALEPVKWAPQFAVVTDPPSRGTPYNLPKTMPVAASMGFWEGIPDQDAVGQLARGANCPMTFQRRPIFGQFFAWSGMNVAFKPKDWLPFCTFIDCPRWDDIWAGFIWQKRAFRLGYCFNLQGPTVTHSRQSNVFQNLRDEAKHLELNETIWRKIAEHPTDDYADLCKLLPI